MISERSEAFLKATEDEIPRIKLLKYRFYASKFPKESRDIKHDMLTLAIEKKLVGEYELIHKKFDLSLDSTHEYRALRDELGSEVNKMINDATSYEQSQNFEMLAPTYMRIANIFLKFAVYQDAYNYFTRLYKMSSTYVTREEYYNEYAIATYFLLDFSDLIKFHKLSLDKGFMNQKIDFCVIKDFKALEMNLRKSIPLRSLFEFQYESMDIMKCSVISFSDLGFLYSLLSLAFQPRSELERDVTWSSGIQTLYLIRSYKELLQKLKYERQFKIFHPSIYPLYDKCYDAIRLRVFVEVVSSFERCPYSMMEKLTGIKEAEGLTLIKNNGTDVSVLTDPVTSSYVFKRDALPLYQEVQKLYKKLNEKFNNEIRECVKSEEEEPMRGMGGMGGMGMMSMMGRKY